MAKKSKKPQSARASRRANDRDSEKIRESLARLHLASAGGSATRPIDVPAASVIEVDATSDRCPACTGEWTITEHRAESAGGQRVRIVTVVCKHCRFTLEKFYRIVDQHALN